jgi:hypothetical protein
VIENEGEKPCKLEILCIPAVSPASHLLRTQHSTSVKHELNGPLLTHCLYLTVQEGTMTHFHSLNDVLGSIPLCELFKT